MCGPAAAVHWTKVSVAPPAADAAELAPATYFCFSSDDDAVDVLSEPRSLGVLGDEPSGDASPAPSAERLVHGTTTQSYSSGMR
jgi:hypothetical protein